MNYYNRLFSVASTRGFEPPTYRLGGGRSILLSYVDKPYVLYPVCLG